MRESSEQAARTGIALTGLEVGLPVPSVGLRLDATIGALSTSWTDVLDDMVAGLAELGRWTDDAATATENVDDSLWNALSGVFR